MNIVIRPYRETDRSALCALTVAAFEGVSIDQNIDRLLGPIAGRDWAWRKARHFEIDVASGAEVAVAAEVGNRPGGRLRHVLLPARGPDRLDQPPGGRRRASRPGSGPPPARTCPGRFRAEGMTIAQIETLEQNAIGRHLFPALGFREVARKIYYALPLEGEPDEGSDDERNRNGPANQRTETTP